MSCEDPSARSVPSLCHGDRQLPAVARGQERSAGFQPGLMPRADLAQSQGCSRVSLPTVTPLRSVSWHAGTHCVPGTCCFWGWGLPLWGHLANWSPRGTFCTHGTHPVWGGFPPFTFQNGFNCSLQALTSSEVGSASAGSSWGPPAATFVPGELPEDIAVTDRDLGAGNILVTAKASASLCGLQPQQGRQTDGRPAVQGVSGAHVGCGDKQQIATVTSHLPRSVFLGAG